MNVIGRLEIALRALAVVLSLGLIAAVLGGILLRPPPPVGYPVVKGQPLLQQTGTGPEAAVRPVRFSRHAIGVGMRCNGHGTIRVVLRPIGAVESPCHDQDTSDGGYVVSDIPNSTSWRIETGSGNRWSLVLTRPLGDGTGWTP